MGLQASLEASRAEIRRHHDQMKLEASAENERHRNDESELEGLRKEVDMKGRELDDIKLYLTRQENDHTRGAGAAFSVFVISLIGTSIVGWSGPGFALGILALSCAAYYLAKNWRDWTS